MYSIKILNVYKNIKKKLTKFSVKPTGLTKLIYTVFIQECQQIIEASKATKAHHRSNWNTTAVRQNINSTPLIWFDLTNVIIKQRIRWTAGSITNIGRPGNKERWKTARKNKLIREKRWD